MCEVSFDTFSNERRNYLTKEDNNIPNSDSIQAEFEEPGSSSGSGDTYISLSSL